MRWAAGDNYNYAHAACMALSDHPYLWMWGKDCLIILSWSGENAGAIRELHLYKIWLVKNLACIVTGKIMDKTIIWAQSK